MKLSSAVLIAVFALVAIVAQTAADQDFSARYAAAAPGDDPTSSGTLKLEIDDDDDRDDDDSIEYEVQLLNAVDVTGIHLHLQGNSSGGLFGGPLVLALTNTTTAPVSSSGDRPLRQAGEKGASDLAANPQRAQVEARLAALGVSGNTLSTPQELAALIRQGLIYTDVHTVTRVSPDGLTRGLVREGELDEGDDGDDGSQSG